MKRIVLLAGIMMAITTIFAQTEKTETRKDTTIMMERHEVKVIETQKGIKVKVFEKTEDNSVEMDPIYESRYQDGQYLEKRNIIMSLPFTKEKSKEMVQEDQQEEKNTKRNKIWYFDEYYSTVYFSYAMLSGRTFGDKSADIPQRPAGFEWGMYPIKTTLYHNNSNTFGFTAALGITNTYNYFNNSYVLATEKGTPYMLELEDNTDINIPEGLIDKSSVSKSFLRYWSLRMPVSAQVQWKLGREVMCLTAGPELEWRFGMRSFARYDGSKHTIADDINYNPLGVNALVQIGYDDFVILGRVALSDLFDSEMAAQPFMLGIGFAF